MLLAPRSGNHEEMQRANGEADEDTEKNDSKKGTRRVFRYAFMHPEDNNISVPMFTYALQEIYDDDLTQVVAIRVWKYVSLRLQPGPCLSLSARSVFTL
jgi:hypothetical protein